MNIILTLAVVFLIIIFPVGCSYIDIEFLKDFFGNKNVGALINNCWNYEKNLELLRNIPVSLGFFKSGDYGVDPLKKFNNNVLLVLDLRNDCSSSQIILDDLNSTNIFVYPLKYLILVDQVNYISVSQQLNNYHILPNCDMIVAVFDNNKNTASLYQIYKVKSNYDLIWENYGVWSSKGGLVENFLTMPLSQRRINLQGANLVGGVVIYENDSLNHLLDYRYPGIDTFAKQDQEPMMCVFKHMNVNISFMYVDNYGYVDPETGLFGGLVRAVQTGKADVSVGSLFFTAERYTAVDLLKQGNPHPIRFLVRKPSTSYIKNIFFITFTKNVWLASIVVMMLFAIVVKIILNWEAKHKQRVRQNRYGFSDVTLIALEAVCQQGTTTEPQSFAGRILALILFGAFMFIYVSYSANIVVLLQSTTKINDVSELLTSRIEVGGHNIHYMKNYFEAVKTGPLRKLYLNKIYPDQYFPLEEGMKKLREGNFAYHVSLQSAYQYVIEHFTNHEICGLQELPGYIEENAGYIGVPKLSPYKDLFKVAILKVDEYGLRPRTNSRILITPKCYSQSATFKSVGFYDCEQVLWIWVAGTIMAFLIFILEILLKKLTRKIIIKDSRNENFPQ